MHPKPPNTEAYSCLQVWVSNELKSLERTNDEVTKEKDDVKKSLNKANREWKDLEHNFKKKVAAFEEKIEDLNNFKAAKATEEKELKNKTKKLEKKAKLLIEKEAKLEVDRTKLESANSGYNLDFQCNLCKLQCKTADDLKKHKKTYHLESCSISTQTVEITVEEKLVQTSKVESITVDKPTQTVDEKAAEQEFQKYPCFYCDINIANEYHLMEHIVKCRGSHRLFPFLQPRQRHFQFGFSPWMPPPRYPFQI